MSTAAAKPVFRWPVRVYYEDTDAGGVVYYANYLKFLERARSEWLRAKGVEQPELLREYSVLLVVRKVAVNYLKPAKFNDELIVTARIASVGRARAEFHQTIEREHVLVDARIEIACVHASGFKPAPFPDVLKNLL